LNHAVLPLAIGVCRVSPRHVFGQQNRAQPAQVAHHLMLRGRIRGGARPNGQTRTRLAYCELGTTDLERHHSQLLAN
jgi:hypothetical protein